MTRIDLLLPTCDRLSSLTMTLTGVSMQEHTNLHLILSDQSQSPVIEDQVVESLLQLIEARGGTVAYHYRIPSQGIAEQRDFLLGQASAETVLYLDDDVLMEPWVVKKLLEAIEKERCAFVGAFPSGLNYLEDVRPDQQQIEFWEGPVQPEAVEPGSCEWERWQLHRAANLYHVGQKLSPGSTRLYKVAWIGACVLYDRAKLIEVGGYSFWNRLPRYHSGEDVLVQNLLMRRWGGCGMVPSGTYSPVQPSTVLNSEGRVDGHALDLLDEMVARYASQTV